MAILSKIEVSIDNNFDEAPNDLPARDTAMIFSSCWFYNLIACAREGEQPVNTILYIVEEMCFEAGEVLRLCLAAVTN